MNFFIILCDFLNTKKAIRGRGCGGAWTVEKTFVMRHKNASFCDVFGYMGHKKTTFAAHPAPCTIEILRISQLNN
jgi:hypothetical protein